MAGGIAHDFNNSLCAIVGFSELLLRDSENGLTRQQAAGPLETILTAAEDASKIVGRLRDFYRADEAPELRHPVQLNKLVEQAISLTQPKWRTLSIAAGHEINLRTDLAELSTISGNAAELREALTNLIFNAADAMPNGGTLTLRTAREGEHVVLRVSDTGTGMSEETRRRCLEPFFTTKGERGTGLGLAMVFGIMQRHAGAVEIESALGEGTTFTLRWPASDAQTEEELMAAEAFDCPLRILVVDDQPVLCQLLSEFLQNDLHTVETAGSGPDALQKFSAAQFDLVITDQVMSGMNGEQLAMELKSRGASVPVILLTGFGEGWVPENERSNAIDMVVPKPFSRSGLRQAITEVVGAAPLRRVSRHNDFISMVGTADTSTDSGRRPRLMTQTAIPAEMSNLAKQFPVRTPPEAAPDMARRDDSVDQPRRQKC
jgi:CheY-like chemotaxis protein/anti-sigma regulatory factor (Ser/Thr protein kinase)